MNHSKAAGLLEKYHRRETSAEENALLETWYLGEVERLLPVEEEIDYEGKEREMWLKIKPVKKATEKNVRLWPRIAIAAAVTAITLSVWLYTSNKQSMKKEEKDIAGKSDAAPGKNTATLTLANGKTIQLSDAKSGVIVSNELKYNDGTALERSNAQLAENMGEAERKINTLAISTPRGGTYQVVLPDGTKVWLNAASVLKFPASFSGTANRTVELTGEAYFEVFKNERQPFVVLADGQQVKVLGTHFNINAYKDESSIKTTLLEGSVQVNTVGSTDVQTKSVRLRPGQQSVLNTSLIKVNPVNTDEVVAWKDGQFIFNEESLSDIMRQLERWYNIKVDYSSLPDTRYDGAISRNVKLSKVLQMLELTGNLKLKIEKDMIKVYQ